MMTLRDLQRPTVRVLDGSRFDKNLQFGFGFQLKKGALEDTIPQELEYRYRRPNIPSYCSFIANLENRA